MHLGVSRRCTQCGLDGLTFKLYQSVIPINLLRDSSSVFELKMAVLKKPNLLSLVKKILAVLAILTSADLWS